MGGGGLEWREFCTSKMVASENAAPKEYGYKVKKSNFLTNTSCMLPRNTSNGARNTIQQKKKEHRIVL